MTAPSGGLRHALVDYLRLRRALGFRLNEIERMLTHFLDYLDDHQADTVTVEHALAWVMLPEGASASWLSHRMSAVRGFATYLHSVDGRAQIPPTRLVPSGRQRAVPYLYSREDVIALIAACRQLRGPLRIATYQTLIGLLSVTGLRIGEAIRLDLGDIDAINRLLIVRESKFGKSRLVPLHPTALTALADYQRTRDQLFPRRSTEAVFISLAGTRLQYCNAQWTFAKLVRRAGLPSRPSGCRPRIHDLRHSFAVATLCDWYATGFDVDTQLPLLSTWLGHVAPAATYWYLSAAPELMALASQRLEPRPDSTNGGPT